MQATATFGVTVIAIKQDANGRQIGYQFADIARKKRGDWKSGFVPHIIPCLGLSEITEENLVHVG